MITSGFVLITVRNYLHFWLKSCKCVQYSDRWRVLWKRQWTFDSEKWKKSWPTETLLTSQEICLMEWVNFKNIIHVTVLEIVGRDGEIWIELQANVTGYMLAGVIWRSRNGARWEWWFLRCSFLKMLMEEVEIIFRQLTYDKGNIWICVMQFDIM
jgi:hypothetical protein